MKVTDEAGDMLFLYEDDWLFKEEIAALIHQFV